MRKKEEIEKEIIELQEERDNLSYKIKELNYELNKNKQHFIERKFKNNYYNITNDWGLTYSSEIDSGTSIEDADYNDFNYFHTEDEAKKYLSHIKLSLKILRARDFVNDGWKPDCELRQFNCLITLSSTLNVAVDYSLEESFLIFKNNIAVNEFRKLITDEEIIEFLSF